MRKLNINILQAIITGVVTVIAGFCSFYFAIQLNEQKYKYDKDILLLQDSLNHINKIKETELKNIKALRLDVEITELMYSLLKDINATHVHLIKVHNGGKELSPTKPKYNTILSEATSIGIRGIKQNYQSRVISNSTMTAYVNSISHKYYIVSNYNDPVFKADNEEILRLRALGIKSYITSFVISTESDLIFLQVSFNKDLTDDDDLTVIKILDTSHRINKMIEKWRL